MGHWPTPAVGQKSALDHGARGVAVVVVPAPRCWLMTESTGYSRPIGGITVVQDKAVGTKRPRSHKYLSRIPHDLVPVLMIYLMLRPPTNLSYITNIMLCGCQFMHPASTSRRDLTIHETSKP